MNLDIDYSRQSEIPFYTNITPIIIGAGGIGYWVGILAAMVGHKNLVVIDADTLELTNLNRIPAPIHDQNKFKVSSLRKVIKILRPKTKCLSVPYNVLDNTKLLETIIKAQINTNLSREFIIYDCTDDARIQKRISEALPTLSNINNDRYIGYVKIAYEGYNIGVYNTMKDIWITDDYRPGYITSSANALSSCFAAVLGMLYASNDYGNGSTIKGIDINIGNLIKGDDHAVKYDK